jgi:hypothetical protein
MDLVLTLVSIASFFALVLAWTVLPATTTSAVTSRDAAPRTASSTQAAH